MIGPRVSHIENPEVSPVIRSTPCPHFLSCTASIHSSKPVLLDPIPSPWTFPLLPNPYYFNQCCDGCAWKDIFKKLLKNFSGINSKDQRFWERDTPVGLWGVLHTVLPERTVGSLSPLGDLLGPLLPHVVTRAGGHQTDSQCAGDQCCLHSVYICVCPQLRGQASLTLTGGMYYLSLEMPVFVLFLVKTLVFKKFLDHQHVKSFSGLGLWGMLFQFMVCLSSCLSWFCVYLFTCFWLFLCCFVFIFATEELSIFILYSSSGVTLRKSVPTSRLCTHLLIGLHFVRLFFF